MYKVSDGKEKKRTCEIYHSNAKDFKESSIIKYYKKNLKLGYYDYVLCYKTIMCDNKLTKFSGILRVFMYYNV